MKKIFVLACLSLFMIVGFSSLTFADDKIGVVNVQRVLAESNAGKAMQQKLQAAKDKMEADLNKKGQEIENLGKQLEGNSVLSPDARAEKEREGRAKVNEFRALEQTYAQDLQSMELRYLEQMQKELSDVVREVATKGNYAVVVNTMSVLYYQKVVDITDDVIKALNGRNIKIN